MNSFDLIDFNIVRSFPDVKRAIRVVKGEPLTGHGVDNGARLQVGYVAHSGRFNILPQDDRYSAIFLEMADGSFESYR